jgi:hypothetical protein
MKFKSVRTTFAAVLISGAAGLGLALAETPASLGTFKDWSAHSLLENGNLICFVVASPEEKWPKNVKHGDVFFMVTNWDRVNSEPSILTGYTFKENSEAVVEVGSTKWRLFTENNGAWLRERSDERTLINAMKRGSSMRVKATSERGTATEYSISLSGITAAINQINSSCG